MDPMNMAPQSELGLSELDPKLVVFISVEDIGEVR